MAAHENLAGGLIASAAALIAGWMAWKAVQMQIAAEHLRTAADRIEVERVLRRDIYNLAEALAAVWKVLDGFEVATNPSVNRSKLNAIAHGMEAICNERWISTSR